MLLKKMINKAAILSISCGLLASPLVMAHPSIELNKDRSAGQDVIDKPQSRTTSNAPSSARNLTRDENDSLDFSPSSRSAESEERSSRRSGYSPKDLTRDEGDSTDW